MQHLPDEWHPVGHAVSGGLSGMFALTVMYPIDVLKTRTTAGVSNAQPGGWYDGLSAGLLAQFTQSGLYYYFYSRIKRFYANLVPENPDPGIIMALSIGSLAAALNQLISLPIGVIHTRMQTDPSAKKRGMIGTAQDISNEKGLAGLWSGLRTALILVVNPSITFLAFERIMKIAKKFVASRGRDITSFDVFLVGALAKLVATVITYPLILGKIRIQARARGGKKEDEEKNQADTLLAVLREAHNQDGFTGLYRGMKTKIVQTCLKSALDFSMKDAITNLSFKMIALLLSLPSGSNVKIVDA